MEMELTVRAGIHGTIQHRPTMNIEPTSTPDSDRTWLRSGLSKEMNEEHDNRCSLYSHHGDKGTKKSRILDPNGTPTPVCSNGKG